MSVFDFLKKSNKSTTKITWHTENQLLYLPIDFIIKKEILSNPHTFGVIYIQGEPYDYRYGNLSDIISPSILSANATLVQCAVSDDSILWNIQY